MDAVSGRLQDRGCIVPPAPSFGRRPMAPSSPARHILAINNSVDVLQLYRDLLEEEGYRVTTATYPLDLAKVRELAASTSC